MHRMQHLLKSGKKIYLKSCFSLLPFDSFLCYNYTRKKINWYKNTKFEGFFMSKGWDRSMLKRLKALVGKGLSTAEMGKKLGMSKNAVVGKLNRLGWNAKATEPAKKLATNAKKEKKSVVARVAKVLTAKKDKSVSKKETKTGTNKKVVAKQDIKKNAKKESVVKDVSGAKNNLKGIKTASKKTKKDLALHELLVQHALQMANLKPNQCRWPIGDPDSDNFHFCGETVFAGKPYCYEHCRQAYQFTAPKKK